MVVCKMNPVLRAVCCFLELIKQPLLLLQAFVQTAGHVTQLPPANRP